MALLALECDGVDGNLYWLFVALQKIVHADEDSLASIDLLLEMRVEFDLSIILDTVKVVLLRIGAR